MNNRNRSVLLKGAVFFLVIGIAYIAGVMTNITQVSDIDGREKLENAMEDFLAYPTAAEYRNVNYHVINQNVNGEETGYFCGEVFGFKNELPYGFKRFIVRYHKNKLGKTMVSIPLIEDVDDILSSEQFKLVWSKYCEQK
ncbi:hypothetical protein [Providencia burhodogranariea]|uniref:Uncharacterized protein n=1 Tax=Providencia burhodogranariea DSM 19968 TaxID=1141662 RepID=K8WSI1_9GAMM|nr:hypothetical protein [Providencia burhodogranariea]EKT63543.1 hypothetical protein OOA_04182 [Providencia burhodogranariea DSM 19968]